MNRWHRVVHPVTRYFGQRRGKYLQRIVPEIAQWRICDLGGSKHFWEKQAIDGLVNSNMIIYNISHDDTQGVHTNKATDIAVVLYDGRIIPAADAELDLLICNSVLEHVHPGDGAKLVAEMKRVAKHILIQTPAYSLPVEPHFIMPFVHWLPRRVGYWLIHFSPWRLLGRPTAQTIAGYWWGTKLLTKSEIKALFPADSIQCEKFFGITKSY